MYNHILFFYYWVVNSLVILTFGLIFPRDVVLGNWRFSSVEAAVYTGFWATFMIWSFWDWAIARGYRLNLPAFRLFYFWTVNTFSFWVASRLANYSGFGITDFFWSMAMALSAYLLHQWVRGRQIATNKTREV